MSRLHRSLGRGFAGSLTAVVLAMAPGAGRADSLPAAPAETSPIPPQHPRLRVSLEGGFELGGTADLPDQGGARGAVGAFGRVRVRLPARFSLAATAAIRSGYRSLDPLARVEWISDLGLELRRAYPVDIPGTDHRTDLYLSVPFGFSELHMQQFPHRAFAEQVETHREPYLGLAGGLAIWSEHLGLFGELCYRYHPIRFTDAVTPLDGSQPPLVERVDSAGHEVMFVLGGAVGL